MQKCGWFRSLANHFKKEFPHLSLSIVRRRNFGKMFGYCQRQDNGRLIIVVHSGVDKDCQIFVLIHELAHAISFHADIHPSDHGGVFGFAYSAAWRSYMRWLAAPPKRKTHGRLKLPARKRNVKTR